MQASAHIGKSYLCWGIKQVQRDARLLILDGIVDLIRVLNGAVCMCVERAVDKPINGGNEGSVR